MHWLTMTYDTNCSLAWPALHHSVVYMKDKSGHCTHLSQYYCAVCALYHDQLLVLFGVDASELP